MTRREIREHVFKQLFLAEFYNSEEYREQCSLYREELEEANQDEKEELSRKAADIAEKIPQLDEQINKVAQGWKTNRMGKVELTIIRLALYEICEDEDVPTKVAINEAVELAKLYGGDDSPAFVNAILGKLAKGME